ncbi:MAG: site-specific DNA-methyltransferase, partial [Rhodospirillales bacterium]|jgi:DNA modification methylase
MRESRVLRVETWPVARLHASPKNPRCHSASQIRQIEASIEAFGWTNPILAAPSGEIVAGEARWEAARRRRLPTVPVIVLDDLDEAERTAYRIADNRLPLGASWDEALLAEVMAGLNDIDFDLQATGFTDAEIALLLAPPEADLVEPPLSPLPTTPITRLGDLWHLGEHRLICADSTLPETLERLLGDGADLVFTDPPYGMSYDGGRARRRPPAMVFTDPPYGMSFGKGKEAGSSVSGATVKAHGMILGDDAQGEELIGLVAKALANAKRWAKPDAAWYVCFTWRTWAEFEAALKNAGLAHDALIVWDKGSVGLGFQHYRPQHEFIFYVAGARWYGGNAEGDVWNFTRGATATYVHPTQKPVELVKRAIENSSLPGDVVLDVFGGSGTTLMACEVLNRRARLVELDPKYCDAIVRRWEAATGRKAKRH